MNSSEELLRQDVVEEYRRTRSYFRVGKALNISMMKVRAILGDEPEPEPMKSREALYGGVGRPEMEKYTVCIKHVNEAWDNQDACAKARADYEAGTHELATGRDGDNLILYAIPRAVPQPRPNYFSASIG
jgi:hypothetical protein